MAHSARHLLHARDRHRLPAHHLGGRLFWAAVGWLVLWMLALLAAFLSQRSHSVWS